MCVSGERALSPSSSNRKLVGEGRIIHEVGRSEERMKSLADAVAGAILCCACACAVLCCAVLGLCWAVRLLRNQEIPLTTRVMCLQAKRATCAAAGTSHAAVTRSATTTTGPSATPVSSQAVLVLVLCCAVLFCAVLVLVLVLCCAGLCCAVLGWAVLCCAPARWRAL